MACAQKTALKLQDIHSLYNEALPWGVGTAYKSAYNYMRTTIAQDKAVSLLQTFESKYGTRNTQVCKLRIRPAQLSHPHCHSTAQ